jgi:hypothetical protein
MSPATITREVKNARSSGEDGQSFIDVVETLTSTDETPEQNAESGGNKQPPPQRSPLTAGASPEIDTPEQIAEEMPEPESAPDSPKPQSTATADPDVEEKPLGARLDLTA